MEQALEEELDNIDYDKLLSIMDFVVDQDVAFYITIKDGNINALVDIKDKTKKNAIQSANVLSMMFNGQIATKIIEQLIEKTKGDETPQFYSQILKSWSNKIKSKNDPAISPLSFFYRR